MVVFMLFLLESMEQNELSAKLEVKSHSKIISHWQLFNHNCVTIHNTALADTSTLLHIEISRGRNREGVQQP